MFISSARRRQHGLRRASSAAQVVIIAETVTSFSCNIRYLVSLCLPKPPLAMRELLSALRKCAEVIFAGGSRKLVTCVTTEKLVSFWLKPALLGWLPLRKWYNLARLNRPDAPSGLSVKTSWRLGGIFMAQKANDMSAFGSCCDTIWRKR